MSKKRKDIEHAEDAYSVRSKLWLRDRMLNDIKGVFVGALLAIETRLGEGFPQYEGLRSEILGIGNNAIRDMHLAIDAVNVEFIPDVMEFNAKDKGKGKETE